MKFLILFITLTQSWLPSLSQNRFEGVIKFKTEFSTTNPTATEFLQSLKNKYGDSLNIYYSSCGHMLRKYLNTGKNGNNYQLYYTGTGKLLLNNRGSNKVDTLDVSKNTLTLLEMVKTKDTVMGIPCNCYGFKAYDTYDQRTITYCYSKKFSRIKSKRFKRYKDYFISNFYKLSKRPYLKFSINARDFNLTFTAVQIDEKGGDIEIFSR